jgi:hypothetical protein
MTDEEYRTAIELAATHAYYVAVRAAERFVTTAREREHDPTACVPALDALEDALAQLERLSDAAAEARPERPPVGYP